MTIIWDILTWSDRSITPGQNEPGSNLQSPELEPCHQVQFNVIPVSSLCERDLISLQATLCLVWFGFMAYKSL